MSGAKYGYEIWWKKAEEDLKSAEVLMNADQGLGLQVGYHAQQAAEKFLKAFLVSRAISPDRTHHLSHLLQECQTLEASLASLKSDCNLLRPFAVEPRYPGLFSIPNQLDSKELINAVIRIRDTIQRVI